LFVERVVSKQNNENIIDMDEPGKLKNAKRFHLLKKVSLSSEFFQIG